jgi:hypothetical protein
VPAIIRGCGTPDARPIQATGTVALSAMTFPAGSMGPKVEACIRFVTASGQPTAIGALTDAADILAGRAGTTITAPRPAHWTVLELPELIHRFAQGDVMAEPEYVVVYTATYPTVAAARAALNTVEQLHKHGEVGKYDAAVIEKENGKPHVAKRVEHPRSRIIPEWFGGGALTRKELNEAAEELLADEAGLIVVGEATIEPALDQALAGTPKVVKREIEATIDQITSELQEAFKG